MSVFGGTGSAPPPATGHSGSAAARLTVPAGFVGEHAGFTAAGWTCAGWIVNRWLSVRTTSPHELTVPGESMQPPTGICCANATGDAAAPVRPPGEAH